MNANAPIRDRKARGSSRTYRWARAVAEVSLRLFYRRIATIDGCNLPIEGPVVIAANHPNYIIDALAIGSRTPRQFHFVAKGPLLDRYPLLSRFLRASGVVPVFRASELPAGGGAADRQSANRDSFAHCADLLEENGVICMFAEGKSHPERRVRELRSGTARIVLEAEARNGYQLGVAVVPAGLYFPQVDRYFSDGAVAFGAPIDTAPFLAQHAEDPTGTARAFTAEIQSRLRDLALHVPDAEWVACVEQVADFAAGWPHREPDAAERLRLTRDVSAALEDFKRAQPADAERFRAAADLLWLAADAWSRHGRRSGSTRLRDAVALPVASFGFVYNMPPHMVLRLWIALFVGSREKRAFVKFLLGVPLFVGWYGLTARWLSQRRAVGRGGPIVASAAAAGPIMGFFGLRMRAHRRRWLDAWRPHNPTLNAARSEQIVEERAELLERLAPWMDETAASAVPRFVAEHPAGELGS